MIGDSRIKFHCNTCAPFSRFVCQSLDGIRKPVEYKQRVNMGQIQHFHFREEAWNITAIIAICWPAVSLIIIKKKWTGRVGNSNGKRNIWFKHNHLSSKNPLVIATTHAWIEAHNHDEASTAIVLPAHPVRLSVLFEFTHILPTSLHRHDVSCIKFACT